jgi:hypothetical protein
LGSALSGTTTPTVSAHFTAVAANGATVDRLLYEVQQVRVTSLAIETTPTGALQETLGLDLARIRWTARSLTTNSRVTTGWDLGTNREF